jgi:beta-N-acetylhexosaminidase
VSANFTVTPLRERSWQWPDFHESGLLIVGFDGHSPTAELVRLIQKERVAGVILFRRNIESVEQIAELNRELRSLAGERPFIIAVDQEGGRVSRLPEPFLRLPPMRTLGGLSALGDARAYTLVEAGGAQVARELLHLGFNLNFAPVVDVDTNPANPVIGDRSFGRSPDVVIPFARALIAGLEKTGVGSCIKHFPGHGDTHLDSHKALPTVDHGPDRLTAVEMAPFKALAADAAPPASVMTAHVLFPEIDAVNPATLSATLLEGTLRRQFGYAGAVISDDLEMHALYDTAEGRKEPVCASLGEASVRSIAAGCDTLLVCKTPDRQWEALEALRKARTDGTLPEDRVTEAFQRTLGLAQSFPVAMARSAPGALPPWALPVRHTFDTELAVALAEADERGEEAQAYADRFDPTER